MLTILGGGGWAPSYGRHTACALIRRGSRAVMIDVGTGLARALERPQLFEGLDHLDVLLTHFHLDHVVGLGYLSALGMSERITIWGPGRLLYDTDTSVVLGQISREPLHPLPLDKQQVEVRDLPGSELDLAGMRIAMRRQDRHSAPTLGFRFDNSLSWITDTAFDPASAPFAQGCRLLAHEAWFTAAAPRNEEIHTSAGQAAEIASSAGVERLLLIHLPPFEQSVQALVGEASAVVGCVSAAADWLEVDLGGSRGAVPLGGDGSQLG